MKENPHLTPWIIPRWAIEGFCAAVRDHLDANDYFVSQVIEHSPTHYLVITSGDCSGLEHFLKEYLLKLFEVKDEEKDE
jgi:hypothetical protein